MQISSIFVSLIIAFFTFVFVTNGKICKNPADYKGKSVCNFQGGNCGAYASFVQICTEDRGTTNQWKPGVKVHGANISVGTAIAKFSRGKYYGQTAIYFSQSTAGIQVWSQTAHHPVSLWNISWYNSGYEDGENFYVIL